MHISEAALERDIELETMKKENQELRNLLGVTVEMELQNDRMLELQMKEDKERREREERERREEQEEEEQRRREEEKEEESSSSSEGGPEDDEDDADDDDVDKDEGEQADAVESLPRVSSHPEANAKEPEGKEYDLDITAAPPSILESPPTPPPKQDASPARPDIELNPPSSEASIVKKEEQHDGEEKEVQEAARSDDSEVDLSTSTTGEQEDSSPSPQETVDRHADAVEEEEGEEAQTKPEKPLPAEPALLPEGSIEQGTIKEDSSASQDTEEDDQSSSSALPPQEQKAIPVIDNDINATASAREAE